LLGNVDFADLFINLSGTPYASLSQAKAAGAPTINYGMFLNTVLNFLIVALAIFLLVRGINRLRRQYEGPLPGPTTKECPYCASTIALKAIRCPQCTSELQAA
jgi:large conductance mechanosensitive channel